MLRAFRGWRSVRLALGVTDDLAVACGDTLRQLDDQGGVIAETQYLNTFSRDPQPLQALAAYPAGGFGVLASSNFVSVDGGAAPAFGFNLVSGVLWDVESVDAGSGAGKVVFAARGDAASEQLWRGRVSLSGGGYDWVRRIDPLL